MPKWKQKKEKGKKENVQGKSTLPDTQEPGEIELLLEAWLTKYTMEEEQETPEPRTTAEDENKSNKAGRQAQQQQQQEEQKYKEDNSKHSEQANHRDAEHQEKQPKKSTPKKRRNMHTTSRMS